MFSNLGKFSLACVLAVSFFETSSVNANPVEGKKSTLQQIRDRGELRCGIRDGAEVGFKTAGKIWCNALAAAINVPLVVVELSVSEIYPAIAGQGGPAQKRVDVSFRTLFERAGRDALQGINFTDPYIYDPVFVRTIDPNYPLTGSIADQVTYINTQVDDYICARDGQAQETLLLNAGVKPFKILETTTDLDEWNAGDCDSIISASTTLKTGSGLSKDASVPFLLAPVSAQTSEKDPAFSDLVKYFIGGMKLAVLEGIDKSKANAFNNPNLTIPAQQLLGEFTNVNSQTTGDLMGLDKDWLRRAIAAEGNYNEIFLASFGFAPSGVNEVNNGANKGLMRALDLDPTP